MLTSAARVSTSGTFSSSTSLRDFARPATIISSAEPIAPATAAAVPPPGVGVASASASRKADIERSANLAICQL
jgi:hypothetical protein